MDKLPSKPLENFEFLVPQLFTTKIFTTKKREGTNSKRKNAGKKSASRDEKNIAPIIQFIGLDRLTFEKV